MQKKWDEFYTTHGRYYLIPHLALRRVVNKFRDLNIKTVLDLGCGSGRNLVKLAELGFNVTGIDYSPSAASLAEGWLTSKNLPGKVYVADIHRKIKSIRRGSYDAVLAVNSIHYTNEGAFEATLNEINRILKTGGLLFLVVPSVEAVIEDLKVEQIFFTEEKLRKYLEDSYRIIELSKDTKSYFVVIAQEK